MKKSIQKPENWQDFESLCKKLFGEIWNCSLTIKKNGRQGQPQCGVDVYAIPENQKKYFGIQCKGKDEYCKATLSKTEIDKEIEKAKTFVPELHTFIFATTANKDAQIEEYIRIKNIESQKYGSFQILLFSWEDLADLIEENRKTFQWYFDNKQFKTNFDFQVQLTEFKDQIEINPEYIRKKKIYKLETPDSELIASQIALRNFLKKHGNQHYGISNPFFPSETNHAWCKFEIIMNNTGSEIIENWKVHVKFINGFRKLSDDYSSSILRFDKEEYKSRPLYLYEDESLFIYKPKNQEPLVQGDNKFFIGHVIPKMGSKTIQIKWNLVAKNFSKEGTLQLLVKPNIEEEEEIIEVSSEALLREDEIEIIEKKSKHH